MRSARLRLWFCVLFGASVLGVPSPALAHTVMMTPPPRDVGLAGNDAHKTGPCGGVPRVGKPTKYAPGATVTVKWMETVGHQGCFQIGFSKANDQGFTVLKQINDPAGGDGMVYTDTVTLPANVTCPACTLVVRQLMQGGTCVGNPADPTTAAQGTYYSCADVCVGDTCTEVDAGMPPADAGVSDGSTTTPGKDGGPTTVPTDGGNKTVDAGDDDPDGTHSPSLLQTGDGGACSVAFGSTTGVSFAVTAGLVGLALLRRCRKK